MAKVVGPSGVTVELDDFTANSLVTGGHAEYVKGKSPEPEQKPHKGDPSGTDGNADEPAEPVKQPAPAPETKRAQKAASRKS